MQCGPKRIGNVFFAQTKEPIKNEPVELFQFCFQLWKAYRKFFNNVSDFCDDVSRNS